MLEYATELSRSPAGAPEATFRALRNFFDERELVELTAMVAWENYRSRFNRGFGLEPQGFSGEGAYCPLPANGSPADPGIEESEPGPQPGGDGREEPRGEP